MNIERKVGKESIRIASISPTITETFIGEIITLGRKYQSDELIITTCYEHSISIYGLENFIALRDFLNELIELREATPLEEKEGDIFD